MRHDKFLDELNLIIAGQHPVPNAKRLEGRDAIRALYYHRHYARRDSYSLMRPDKPDGGPGSKTPGELYLHTDGMSSKYDGQGIAIFTTNGEPDIYTYAICEHKWDETGANHSRGWHPRRCTECGFDASIDSGD